MLGEEQGVDCEVDQCEVDQLSSCIHIASLDRQTKLREIGHTSHNSWTLDDCCSLLHEDRQKCWALYVTAAIRSHALARLTHTLRAVS